jgi:hypothetical protein
VATLAGFSSRPKLWVVELIQRLGFSARFVDSHPVMPLLQVITQRIRRYPGYALPISGSWATNLAIEKAR